MKKAKSIKIQKDKEPSTNNVPCKMVVFKTHFPPGSVLYSTACSINCLAYRTLKSAAYFANHPSSCGF